MDSLLRSLGNESVRVIRTRQNRLEHRVIYLAVSVLWLGVTIAAFGFHHHAAGEDCEDVGCPFALVALNLPILVVALVLVTGDIPSLTDPAPVWFPGHQTRQVPYLRGPPQPFFV